MNPQEAVDDAIAVTARVQEHLIHLAAYGRVSQNTRSIVTLNFYASQFLQMNLRERVRWMLLGRLPDHLAEFVEDPEGAVLMSEVSESTSQISEM